MNIKVVLEYDGTNFCGWQVQPGQRSVQGVIEDALLKLTGCEVRIHGSGRTDAGVHALGQVAHFHLSSSIAPGSFKPALNGILPDDVKVRESAEVPEGFHARHSARFKTYIYKLVVRDYRPPLFRNRAWHVRKPLDMDRVKEALGQLIGTHDFKAFCASGSPVQSTVRTVTHAEVRLSVVDDTVEFLLRGNGFLYNMVRIIAGAAVAVGSGKISPTSFPEALAGGNRALLDVTAPAHGLYLESVEY